MDRTFQVGQRIVLRADESEGFEREEVEIIGIQPNGMLTVQEIGQAFNFGPFEVTVDQVE